MLFHCFYDSYNFVSKYCENALIEICSKFAIIEAIMATTTSLKRFIFLKKNPGTEKHKDK